MTVQHTTFTTSKSLDSWHSDGPSGVSQCRQKCCYCGRHVPIIFRFSVVCHQHAINVRIYLRAASCERSWRPCHPLLDRQVELLKCINYYKQACDGRVAAVPGQRSATVNGAFVMRAQLAASYHRMMSMLKFHSAGLYAYIQRFFGTNKNRWNSETRRIHSYFWRVRRLYANLNQLSFAVTMSKTCRIAYKTFITLSN